MWTEAHDINDSYFQGGGQTSGPIIIENRAWIGSNSIILDNVHIGEGAVVCAGTVVTKNVEPFTVVAGVSAKKINTRNNELKYTFNGEHTYFL